VLANPVQGKGGGVHGCPLVKKHVLSHLLVTCYITLRRLCYISCCLTFSYITCYITFASNMLHQVKKGSLTYSAVYHVTYQVTLTYHVTYHVT
jgi:hypothetical protein